MINRALIRIRVIQTLFSHYLNKNSSIQDAKDNLTLALESSYDLYFQFLALLIHITDEYDRRVEAGKKKLLPTEKDINPNTALLSNALIIGLKKSEKLEEHLSESSFDWAEHDLFIKKTLDKILESELYQEYSLVENDFAADKNFWRTVFRQIILEDDELYDLLEDANIHWNDDIEIVQSFALKTIRQFDIEASDSENILPMYRDDTDRDFALKLTEEAIKQATENSEYIDKFIQNWETERLANMDMIIMQAALAEIKTFDTIPVSVSLNEYINISKSYSTEKSPAFINGVLDSIVKELQEQKIILKDK